MARYEITAEMNLQNLINESREVSRALSEFADNLERIEKKYTTNEESVEKRMTCKDCKYCKWCIMSYPDGRWKACDDFEPKAESEDEE